MCHLCDATEAESASFAIALARSRASAWAASAARSAWLSVRPVRRDCRIARHHALASSGTTGQKMVWQVTGSPVQRRCRRQALFGQNRWKQNWVLIRRSWSRQLVETHCAIEPSVGLRTSISQKQKRYRVLLPGCCRGHPAHRDGRTVFAASENRLDPMADASPQDMSLDQVFARSLAKRCTSRNRDANQLARPEFRVYRTAFCSISARYPERSNRICAVFRKSSIDSNPFKWIRQPAALRVCRTSVTAKEELK